MQEKDIATFSEDPHLMALLPAEQLYGMSATQMQQIQLQALRKRFAALVPDLRALNKLAKENRIADFDEINGVVPLLFPHTKYKSYPLALIDNCMFQQMNTWLDDYTTHDLSGLDVSHCQSLDEWLEVLEAETSLNVMTSSGTSGKISIVPRSRDEDKFMPDTFAAGYLPYRDEPGLRDIYAREVYFVSPFALEGRHSTGRIIQNMAEYGAHGDNRHMVTVGGKLSTDLLWMTGRMRKAQADGKVDQLKQTKAWQRLSGRMTELEKNKAKVYDEFYKDVIVRLKDKTVVLTTGLNYYFEMVRCAEKYGLEIRFAEDSMLIVAGGLKGSVLSAEQIDKVYKTIPHKFMEVYGCSELITGLCRKCAKGHYHPPPWIVSFVLDPETGAPYPRQGTRTGRFAGFDLLAETYWGGFITGDKVTVNYDGGCGCGRNGSYLYGDVVRYADIQGGDDKINCQRTADAVEEMTEYLEKL